MRIRSAAVTLFCFCLLPALAGAAPVVHGDFAGLDLGFESVTETTSTAGDPMELVGAPTPSGNSLLFSPAQLVSSASAGASDGTSSDLSIRLAANPGRSLTEVAIQMLGDSQLTAFPPFGTPATNASVQLAGTATVLETASGPIAPVVIPFLATATPTGNFSLPVDFGTAVWSLDTTIDIGAVVPDTTVVELQLALALASNTPDGQTSATIQGKVLTVGATLVDGPPPGPDPSAPIPEPSSALVFAIGLVVVSRVRRRA